VQRPSFACENRAILSHEPINPQPPPSPKRPAPAVVLRRRPQVCDAGHDVESDPPAGRYTPADTVPARRRSAAPAAGRHAVECAVGRGEHAGTHRVVSRHGESVGAFLSAPSPRTRVCPATELQTVADNGYDGFVILVVTEGTAH
jgi:hypothetical protein